MEVWRRLLLCSVSSHLHKRQRVEEDKNNNADLLLLLPCCSQNHSPGLFLLWIREVMQRKCSLHCPDPKAARSKAQISHPPPGGTEGCLEPLRDDLTCLSGWCCQFRLFHTELFLGITRDSPPCLLPHTSWRNPLLQLVFCADITCCPGSYPGRECRCSHGCLSSPFPFSRGQRQQRMLFPAHCPPWRMRSRAGSCGCALLLSPGHPKHGVSQTAGVSVPAEPAQGEHSSQCCMGTPAPP